MPEIVYGGEKFLPYYWVARLLEDPATLEEMIDSDSLLVFCNFYLEMVIVQECDMVQYHQSKCYLFLQEVHCSPLNIPRTI